MPLDSHGALSMHARSPTSRAKGKHPRNNQANLNHGVLVKSGFALVEISKGELTGSSGEIAKANLQGWVLRLGQHFLILKVLWKCPSGGAIA